MNLKLCYNENKVWGDCGMTYIFLFIGIVFTTIFISKRTAKVTLYVAFIKAVSSVCFILTGLFAMIENPDCPKIVGALVAAGGVWGMLGDIALDLKYVFKKYDEQYLNAGFSSFGVGHFFYIAALICAFGINEKIVLFGLIGVVLNIIFVFLGKPLLKVNIGKFKPITTVYMSILGFVHGMSVGYAVFDFSIAKLILAIGFTMFFISDLLLSGLYFGATQKERTSRPAIILNHTFYYSAQFLIAVSLLFV